MPSEIQNRLQSLLAATGLNGPVAGAEAAAEAEALAAVETKLQALLDGVFLAQAQGEYLHRFQNQLRPDAAHSTAQDMVEKMTLTGALFPFLEVFALLPETIQYDYAGHCLYLTGIHAGNCTQFADTLRLLRHFLPPFFGIELGGSGVPWSVFDTRNDRFYTYDRAGLSWQMIQTMGEET